MKGRNYFAIGMLLAAGRLAIPVMVFMGCMLIFGAMAHVGRMGVSPRSSWIALQCIPDARGRIDPGLAHGHSGVCLIGTRGRTRPAR